MSIPQKASLWYAVCNIFQKGISFVVVPIYTHVLSSQEYGQYTVFLSWCNLLSVIVTLNLFCGVYTKAMVDYNKDRDRYTASMQGLSTIVSICVCCIYIIGSKYFQDLLEMDNITLIILLFYYITHPAFMFWTVRERVEYRYKRMVVVTILTSVLVPVLSLILLYTTSLRANAIIWGFLIVQTLTGFFFYIFHFAKSTTFYDKSYWIYALKYNIPLIPHYLSLIVLGQSDRIMIKYYCGYSRYDLQSCKFLYTS